MSTQYPAPPGTISNSDTLWKATTKCGQGEYNNKWHQAACFTCPRGFYCRALGITDDFTDCPVGNYCPPGVKDPTECPQGTYNPTPNSWEPFHCLDCPPGKYCGSKGLSAPTGDCDPGYFCSKRAFEAAPAEIDDKETPARWGPCPPGHYCPAGTAFPFKCPIGKYNDAYNKIAASDCKSCDAGHYGETTGLTVSTCTGKCAPGFRCDSGSTTHSPEGTLGDRCREGTYCVEGSSSETNCFAGTYNPHKGQRECLPCPAGFFCIAGDPTNPVTWEPQKCAKGHSC